MTEASAFTGTLVAANQKIIGATVTNPAGETLGTVDDLMIDPTDGRVFYAVMSFGGILGLGKQYYPVPWALLTSDPSKDGFLVDLDKARLENAPNYGLNFEWTRRYASEVDSHYGIPRPPP
jgi:sporulation protein YlmC with PRC-barrel domain